MEARLLIKPCACQSRSSSAERTLGRVALGFGGAQLVFTELRDRPLVTIEHVAASPDCNATVMIKMLPAARFDTPIGFKGSIRIIVPSGRFD
jgi:hypothetical protein